MLIIKVKKGDKIDKYLKKFKKKFDQTGILKEFRKRTHFVKSSVKRKNVISKAKYIQKLKQESFQ